MRRALRFTFYIVPLLLWMCVIFYMSNSSSSGEHSYRVIKRLLNWMAPGSAEELSYPSLHAIEYIMRKMSHVSEYAILTFLGLRAIHYGRPDLSYKHIGIATGFAFLYALSDEIHQIFVPGRSGLGRDVLIDGIGIGIVVLPTLFWRVHRLIDNSLTDSQSS